MQVTMLVQMMMQTTNDCGVCDNKSLTNASHIYKMLKHGNLLL
jgi:hypothetical protein